MPTLLEIERAFYRSLTEPADPGVAGYVLADGIDPEVRLDIHRDTLVGTLTNVLRLAFPAVERLVGEAFFESAARIFIEAAPPRGACLDEYGGAFADFLKEFPPAASVAYLPDVARLEWAVNCAWHAPDTGTLDPGRLAAVDPEHYDRIVFVPHPSSSLLRAAYPVDEIRRTVLAQDDEAMAAVDLDDGPVHLLVKRLGTNVDVQRLSEPESRFMGALRDGLPLGSAAGAAPRIHVEPFLVEHLAGGSFACFELSDPTRGVGDQSPA